jgi:predicted metal-dependent peptidase
MGHLGDAGPPNGELGNICADLSVNSVMPAGMRHPFHLHPSQFEVDGKLLPVGRGWKFYWDQLVEVFNLGEIDGMTPEDAADRSDLGMAFGMKGSYGTEPGSLIYSLTKQKLERAANSMDKSKIPQIVDFMLKTKYAPLDVIWHVAFKSTCRGFTRTKKLRTMGKRGRRTRMPPGPQKSGQPTIVWGIDTSGSMAEHELDKGYAVLDEIRQRDGVRVLVQQFDSVLQGPLVELDKYKKMPTEILGRGGTDFGPLFELAKKINPSVLCVFTDGQAAEVKQPSFPTCWVYTPEHKKQKFGKHIVINDRPDTSKGEW